ncbi:hypothetical protein Tco_0616547 [Tanacetum coccineum]
MWLLLQGVSTFNDNQMESLGIKRDEFGLVLRNAKAKKDTWQRSRRLLNADSGTDAEAIRTVEKRNDSFAFVHELKQEMHADLKYVESLEDEIDELESDKAEFSNMFGFAAALAVLVTGASQSRQHESHHRFFPVDTSLIHIESRKSPTKSLFDVGSRRISIFTVNTKEYHSDVLAIITRIMRRT